MISSYISLVDEDESTVVLSSDEEELPEVSVTQTRYIYHICIVHLCLESTQLLPSKMCLELSIEIISPCHSQL